MLVVVWLFVFRQKTAYELRISDWSSGVCSSDLLSDLVWGSKSLGGFNRGDLAEDLGDDQIRAVLGLFGSDMVAYAPPSRAAGIGIDRTGLTGIKIGRASCRERVCQYG